jgi:hypothetical protein
MYCRKENGIPQVKIGGDVAGLGMQTKLLFIYHLFCFYEGINEYIKDGHRSSVVKGEEVAIDMS